MKKLLGGALVAVGLIGAAALTFAGGPIWDDWILDARGELAIGRAIDMPEGSTIIGVEFFDKSGHKTTAKIEIAQRSMDRAKRGEGVRVQYDPANPDRVREQGMLRSKFGGLVFLPLALAALGGLTMLFSRAAEAEKSGARG